MITKLIKVNVKPGHMDQYLAAQEVWNRESRPAPGYLGCDCSRDTADPSIVYLHCVWRTRADLDRWMATDHDRIAALAGADDHYERLEVRILESLPGDAPVLSPVSGDGTSDAGEIQTWSEIYRASAALRIAVRLELFEQMTDGPVSVDRLASNLQVDAEPLRKVLTALEAMGLTACQSGKWRNTPLADRTLVKGVPAYQGDMVLHNTQPEHLARVYGFGERLGLPPDAHDDDAYQPLFLAAMNNTASAGQAEALVSAVDLTGCRTMLDIGGATGPYAIALCKAYPQLTSRVLDLPETVDLAAPFLAAAGMTGRITVEAHDYRTGPFPGPVDAALISNVLRGEAPPMIDDILRRVHGALKPGGHLIITDLFPEDPRPDIRLRAGLFGLHIPDGANYTLDQMADAARRAGFELLRSEYLTRCTVLNAIVEARRAD